MSTDIVATSQNIENIASMLTKLENIKDDSSKLRISLKNQNIQKLMKPLLHWKNYTKEWQNKE